MHAAVWGKHFRDSIRIVRPRRVTDFHFKIVVVINLLDAPYFTKCLQQNKLSHVSYKLRIRISQSNTARSVFFLKWKIYR